MLGSQKIMKLLINTCHNELLTSFFFLLLLLKDKLWLFWHFFLYIDFSIEETRGYIWGEKQLKYLLNFERKFEHNEFDKSEKEIKELYNILK